MEPATPEQPSDFKIAFEKSQLEIENLKSEIINLKALLEKKDAVIKTLNGKVQSWMKASDPHDNLAKRITPSMPPGTGVN